MKQLLFVPFFLVAACATLAGAVLSDGGNVIINGVAYKIVHVSASSGGSAHRGEIIFGEHSEVEVDGNWYECISSCRDTALAVLQNNAANATPPPGAVTPAPGTVPTTDGGGGGSGGGY